jgi:hypothetical protein
VVVLLLLLLFIQQDWDGTCDITVVCSIVQQRLYKDCQKSNCCFGWRRVYCKCSVLMFPFTYKVPSYVLTTSKGSLIHVAPGFEDFVTVVGQSQDAAVTCLASHPQRTMIAVGSYSGRLQVWNYASHTVGSVSRSCGHDCSWS